MEALRDDKGNKERLTLLPQSLVQKAVMRALATAGATKSTSCHRFRHSFATHLLAGGQDIHTIQELLGHKDMGTIMIETHVLNRGQPGVRRPADL